MNNKVDNTDLIKNWETQVAQAHTGLSATHAKNEYTFTSNELRQMVKLFTIKELADQMLNDKLNNDVLPRLKISANPKVKVLYDLQLGRLTVWLPKEDKKKNNMPTTQDLIDLQDPKTN